MKKYSCGLLALKQWKIPFIDSFLRLVQKELTEESMVFTDRAVYRPHGVELHSCKIAGAEKYISGNLCSIPLLYITLANTLSKTQLIYLGLLICSHQSGQKPLCTVEELKKCATELKGLRGRRCALQALQYVCEGARSPMEAILYMFLRLPNHMGGCGFKTVSFDKRVATRDGRNIYFADLIIPEMKLILEYDSYEYHNNKKSFVQDAVRAMRLEESGYQVISVRSEQLYRLDYYKTLTQNIARRLGKSIRIRARKFFENFQGLRNLLKNNPYNKKHRCQKVRLSDVPAYPGVKKMYRIYEQALERLNSYPDSKLTLNVS